ncbi:MAG TPA: hypothetical protein VK150_02910 [Geothrix sp.]|nr:hypothetical protein [Geothrix sp.]
MLGSLGFHGLFRGSQTEVDDGSDGREVGARMGSLDRLGDGRYFQVVFAEDPDLAEGFVLGFLEADSPGFSLASHRLSPLVIIYHWDK